MLHAAVCAASAGMEFARPVQQDFPCAGRDPLRVPGDFIIGLPPCRQPVLPRAQPHTSRMSRRHAAHLGVCSLGARSPLLPVGRPKQIVQTCPYYLYSILSHVTTCVPAAMQEQSFTVYAGVLLGRVGGRLWFGKSSGSSCGCSMASSTVLGGEGREGSGPCVA